jgi:hypothetical protein
MDGFKVAYIFAKVEFVRYISNMCTVRLRLKLSFNYDRLGIEFESLFVSLGPINMRVLPCNSETTWRLVWVAAWLRWCSNVYGEERP